MIKRLRRWFGDGNRQFKISVYDPSNFNEIFDITASKIQISSFVTLFAIVIGFLFLLLIKATPLESYFFSSSHVSRTQIVEQSIRVDSLTKKIEAQDRYIAGLKNLLFGNFDTTSVAPSITHVDLDPNTINEIPSDAEQKIHKNVQTDRQIEEEALYVKDDFVAPVVGKISQRFIEKTHEGIDIVVRANTAFVSCLPGRVVLADYSQLDGNILIIKHDYGFLSIYKHARSIYKKRGDKVKAGEKIGLVGNTGSNSTGPHLHFELWLHQKAVNPKKYMNFEK